MDINQFGHTNNREYFDQANAFREAAKADGWECSPCFGGESAESYAKLSKDGFKMHVCARTNVGKWAYQAEVSIWAPDGLAIHPPTTYNWTLIQAGVRTCNSCGATDVDTQRFSFAGRCCAACLPKMRELHEKGNWTA